MQEKDRGRFRPEGLKEITPKFFKIFGDHHTFKLRTSQINWTVTFRHIHIDCAEILRQTGLRFS
jgi:hypothetical protein